MVETYFSLIFKISLALNSAPVIINLPLMSDVIVSENAPLGSSVFQVSYTDRNVGDNHVITASFTPTSGSGLFSMNTSSKLNNLTVLFFFFGFIKRGSYYIFNVICIYI